MTGCCLPHSRNSLAEIAAIEVVEPTETEIIIFGFDDFNVQTPDLIPPDILPEPDVYTINTRILIEGQPVEIMQDGKMIEGMWWARDPDDVQRDIDNAEKVYSDLGIKFHVSEISFREMNPNLLDHFIGANLHPGLMTVVYMLPNNFQWDGYSSAPWEMVNRGIIVHYLADDWTLAHEIGHYFGLLHPFAEDYVSDTPEQESKYCTGPEHSTRNCHNIMNYCDHTPKMATPGQLERFKRFLRASRMDHFVREYTDIMLRGHKFPTPSGTKVIFNINIEDPVREVNSP